jgi:hypothetical protein
MSSTLLAATLLASVPAAALESRHYAVVTSGDIIRPGVVLSRAFQGSGMTLEEAVAQVRRQYDGRIVSAETQVSAGQEMHIIKVLTSDGKVKTVRIPGRKL